MLAQEQYRPWAEVAAELGYVDQSHVIRDVTAAVGSAGQRLTLHEA